MVVVGVPVVVGHLPIYDVGDPRDAIFLVRLRAVIQLRVFRTVKPIRSERRPRVSNQTRVHWSASTIRMFFPFVSVSQHAERNTLLKSRATPPGAILAPRRAAHLPSSYPIKSILAWPSVAH